ncbi:hypothetical protein QRX50_37080 [Amycolatopsis carbonis]|uniref:Uncharacterized protein n=1 Tax=Amycolatopsis carbonis TaxID=715471 RepID=A0A9Y2MQ97_9PSEU|nr:hypothetical protein [Amycolatopsis sp. 2-15]WIX76990.1 hypothetical protein QRX50_37080 [Amycolatopsis sp. 2-15]
MALTATSPPRNINVSALGHARLSGLDDFNRSKDQGADVTSGEHGSRLYVTWHRCVADNLDHAVTDDAVADGIARHEGRYRTLCGRDVLFHSCLMPPGRPCTTCKSLVWLRTATPSPEPASHRKPSCWRWVFGRLQTPAALLPRPPQRVRFIPEQDSRTTTSAGTGSTPSAPAPADHHRRRPTR